uniref:Uncharacterized protein n=1 Tax=Oryza brachyantha TaxID=4533 RepID=J3LD10_ORYBR
MNSNDDHEFENNLQELEDAMHEFGVYASDVQIVSEQEELNDSNYEVKHTNKNLTDIQRKDIYAALVHKLARPRYNEENICTFDGKTGVWPFTRKIAQPLNQTLVLKFHPSWQENARSYGVMVLSYELVKERPENNRQHVYMEAEVVESFVSQL